MSRRIALLVSASVLCAVFVFAAFRRASFDVSSLRHSIYDSYADTARASTEPISSSKQEPLTSSSEQQDSPASSSEQQSHAATKSSSSDWKFTAARDRNDHSLTSEQCDAAFPDLYHEINRARSFWRERQGDEKLTEDQWGVDWTSGAGLRGMIYNGQLYVTESKGLNHFLHWEERSKATLANIHRAIVASREPIPNIEFGIKIDDNIHLEEGTNKTTTWCFSRNVTDPAMEQVWLIPDFNFWAYPRVAGNYGDYQREAIRIGDNWEHKINKLVWRGTQAFNPGIRQALIDISANQSWSDVHTVAEDSDDAESAKYKIAMPDHCKYRYAVHTEGTTWSGRLKYLLSCHSTIIVHKLTFHTHLYHLLKHDGPEQNIVQTERNWTDLPEKMEALQNDDELTRRIADNARDMFRDRYMTPAAQTCYFRRLFKVWAEMTTKPDPYVLAESHRHSGKTELQFRGMTYEEYIFHKENYPL